MNENINAGIHPNAQRDINRFFTERESKIARFWANEWYITKAGKVSLGISNYNYMLIKATITYEEALGLAREIVVVFSEYDHFEPRTLDAYDAIYKQCQQNRLERICYVIISADDDIDKALRDCLSMQEAQIVVPFTYANFTNDAKGNPNFLRNQFRKYFYSRDLFDFSDPLKKDYYFFGRNDITVEIVGKHTANQNFGLFGLRKTGKTSIIYDTIRKLQQKDAIGVLIDCQDTSFNFRSWNHALYYVIFRIVEETKVSLTDLKEEDFTPTNASVLFKHYIQKANKVLSKSILLLFDEIENITFGKSSVEHWCEGLDFVYFWQSIRSTFQKTENVFSFCILGTNPRCVEVPTVLGKDNPIFNVFQPKYIPGFDQSQTREMIRKLGRLMGINFDEAIYTRLMEDYGGHPFLMRQFCSKLAQKYSTRPVQIDRIKYNSIKDTFNRESDYFNMLLEVLIQFYPDEYEMLKILASGDTETFEYFAKEDYSLVKHLIGYGIIRNTDGIYDFQIDAIKDYLLSKIHQVKLTHSSADKWTCLCATRNKLETDLRKMVKTILRFAYKSEADAKEYVVKKIYGKDVKKYLAYTYADLFDSRKSNIYLKSLRDLINGNWENFKDFWPKQDMFMASMNILNQEGRFDAHATLPTDDEMVLVDGAVCIIQKGIDSFNATIS